MSDKGMDIFGIRPLGEAINTTVSKSLDGIGGFLKIVCAPALEEVGLLVKDHVRLWRLNNIIKVLEKAKDKLEFADDQLQIKAHPRVALSIIENSSMNDNDEIQNLWAGLFVSSCTIDGQDDENLIFVDLLKQITVVEAKILRYACENCKKVVHKNGLFTSNKLKITFKELCDLTTICDIHRLDRELDHLRSLELIGSSLGGGGFVSDDESLTADITPTALALNLYIKTQGSSLTPDKYWTENLMSYEEYEKELEKEWGILKS